MCGIIGYVGKEQALPIILKGLEMLEYRGYDSAGIVVENKKGLEVAKCKGRIKKLKELTDRNAVKGNIGLGHTRWATHGVPSEQNAHPHTDCTGKISIVHNGIVENYHKLKKKLIKKGHKFKSETDSEVIAHLIEEELKKAKDFELACRRALEQLEGSYAVGIVSKNFPNKIIGARLNSPLIVGVGNSDENFIASDVPAILNRTRKIIYLGNSEIVVLDSKKIKITDLTGRNIPYEINEIEWGIDTVEKQGYEKFMLKEIYEQPQVIKKCIMGRINKN